MPKQQSKQKSTPKRKAATKQWDILSKLLTQANPNDLVSWVLPGSIYKGELNVELQKHPPIFADLLYTIVCRRKKAVLHVEFQRRGDKKMGERVWEYNCQARMYSGLPVYSVVIYLVEEGPIVEPPYLGKFPTGVAIHTFVYEHIKLWEIPPEVLKQLNLPGLLPLLPLTKDGNRREVVEDMIGSLEQANRRELLPLGYAFSALRLKGPEEQQWLKERFNDMGDILESSWAYQEMVQKAVAKAEAKAEAKAKEALEKEKKKTIVRFVELHFPALLLLAKKQVKQAKTLEQLQGMLDKLFIAHTDDEAKTALLE